MRCEATHRISEIKKKDEQRNPEDIKARELTEYICEFILRVK